MNDLLPGLLVLSLAGALLGAGVALRNARTRRRDMRRMYGAGAVLGGIALLLMTVHEVA